MQNVRNKISERDIYSSKESNITCSGFSHKTLRRVESLLCGAMEAVRGAAQSQL